MIDKFGIFQDVKDSRFQIFCLSHVTVVESLGLLLPSKLVPPVTNQQVVFLSPQELDRDAWSGYHQNGEEKTNTSTADHYSANAQTSWW